MAAPVRSTSTSSRPVLWFGLGALLFGVGYVAYDRYKEGKRRIAYFDKHAPEIIESVLPGFGKRIAEVGQARSRS